MKASALFIILTTFVVCGGFAADRDDTLERKLDQRIVGLLAEESTMIVVGEPVDYSMHDRYGLALNARMPFKVKVRTVLKGERRIEGESIRVGVTRDEVKTRYAKGELFVFFLKPDPSRGTVSPEPAAQTEWRVVSDYFGVQRYTLALERMIRESSKSHDKQG